MLQRKMERFGHYQFLLKEKERGGKGEREISR